MKNSIFFNTWEENFSSFYWIEWRRMQLQSGLQSFCDYEVTLRTVPKLSYEMREVSLLGTSFEFLVRLNPKPPWIIQMHKISYSLSSLTWQLLIPLYICNQKIYKIKHTAIHTGFTGSPSWQFIKITYEIFKQ